RRPDPVTLAAARRWFVRRRGGAVRVEARRGCGGRVGAASRGHRGCGGRTGAASRGRRGCAWATAPRRRGCAWVRGRLRVVGSDAGLAQIQVSTWPYLNFFSSSATGGRRGCARPGKAGEAALHRTSEARLRVSFGGAWRRTRAHATGRYRVNCAFKSEGCPWRMHVATLKDDATVKVTRNPYPHDCQSTRRAGICVGITQFWVCQQVVDWLKEDSTLGATELQRRLKDAHKILVPYRRVYKDGHNWMYGETYSIPDGIPTQ
ncbi:unnamed protein product, partial [Urochloa humidicola]